MAYPIFSFGTLDDVMRSVIETIQAHGEQIYPTKGKQTGALELTGVLLELTNPRARLSRTETRGKLFSSLGELCWYLSKSNDLAFIQYYLPGYRYSADGDEIFGGYGPRLFDWKERNHLNQVAGVTEILRKKPDSRQAVIQLFDANDIVATHKDVPCTCTLQLMLRQGSLRMFTNMRSNDVHKGLPHDVFCFTMLQEIMARTLSVEIDTYKHAVGSLHLYVEDREIVQQFLEEGWQSTIDVAMPDMPTEDPWPAISLLLEAESAIRTSGAFDDDILRAVGPYWADLIRLLQIFRCKKDKNIEKIQTLRQKMVSKVYLVFIDAVLSELV